VNGRAGRRNDPTFNLIRPSSIKKGSSERTDFRRGLTGKVLVAGVKRAKGKMPSSFWKTPKKRWSEGRTKAPEKGRGRRIEIHVERVRR